MDHPYLDHPTPDDDDTPIIIAVNEADAEDYRFANPTLADIGWMTPSQYIRRGTRAPRRAYTTLEVRQLSNYPLLKAAAQQLFKEDTP